MPSSSPSKRIDHSCAPSLIIKAPSATSVPSNSTRQRSCLHVARLTSPPFPPFLIVTLRVRLTTHAGRLVHQFSLFIIGTLSTSISQFSRHKTDMANRTSSFAAAPVNDNEDRSPFLSLYFAFQILGGHIGFPCLLAVVFAVGSASSRHPLFINFCVIWVLSSVSFCIL
jgi:hypothetical protein